MGTCTPWAKRGVHGWTEDHRQQKKGVPRLGGTSGGEKGVPAPDPPSAHFLHPSPGSQGMPLSQRDFLTFSGTECVLSCSPLSVLTSLICGIRPRLPASGLFLLLSVKGWVLSVSDSLVQSSQGSGHPLSSFEASCKASLKSLLL